MTKMERNTDHKVSINTVDCHDFSMGTAAL